MDVLRRVRALRRRHQQQKPSSDDDALVLSQYHQYNVVSVGGTMHLMQQQQQQQQQHVLQQQQHSSSSSNTIISAYEQRGPPVSNLVSYDDLRNLSSADLGLISFARGNSGKVTFFNLWIPSHCLEFCSSYNFLNMMQNWLKNCLLLRL